MASFDGDPEHSILADAWQWELVEFAYRRDPTSRWESYIDMVFARDGKQRRLRFIGPQELEISRGLPNSMGMCILDVSSRQLEGLRVRVANFEQFGGAPSFWATQVVEIAEQDDA